MNINTFVSNFKNHPVLFIGSGISMRYLETSYSWDGLLKHISYQLFENEESYLDLKAKYMTGNEVLYEKVASDLEVKFEKIASEDRNGKFKDVNDIFYENMQKNIKLSRLKIYISLLLPNSLKLLETDKEYQELIKIRKNISSIITTNYDQLIENIFGFSPLIGNDILLSNPYGSVYKIHGCVSSVKNIVLTADDYQEFENKYELIRAQLLSLFIHNPIIFLGYSVSDDNIRKILKTIFMYVEPNSQMANKIKSNFLIVEYEKGSKNKVITEYDIILDDGTNLRLNKLKTDDYFSLYKELANLQLPVSAMDIRKVQSVVREIYEGGEVKVEVVGDLDKLKNSDKILAIGNKEHIRYDFQRPGEMMTNYFKLIEEDNYQLLSLIDKHHIQDSQFFPIFGFNKINSDLKTKDRLIDIQLSKLLSIFKVHNITNSLLSIKDILANDNIAKTYKTSHIIYGVIHKQIDLDDVEKYLKELIIEDQSDNTNFRKILCAYDFVRYSDQKQYDIFMEGYVLI